jgi:hypothetical protein
MVRTTLHARVHRKAVKIARGNTRLAQFSARERGEMHVLRGLDKLNGRDEVDDRHNGGGFSTCAYK